MYPKRGITFNVEPAAYRDGYGGIRHCDTIALTAEGAEVPTSAESSHSASNRPGD